jgi:hypothetical protein
MVNPAINGWAIFKNPNGIQIHQPKVGGPRLPWETVPTNSSTLRALSGRPENSPAIHGWDSWRAIFPSPGGDERTVLPSLAGLLNLMDD